MLVCLPEVTACRVSTQSGGLCLRGFWCSTVCPLLSASPRYLGLAMQLDFSCCIRQASCTLEFHRTFGMHSASTLARLVNLMVPCAPAHIPCRVMVLSATHIRMPSMPQTAGGLWVDIQLSKVAASKSCWPQGMKDCRNGTGIPLVSLMYWLGSHSDTHPHMQNATSFDVDLSLSLAALPLV